MDTEGQADLLRMAADGIERGWEWEEVIEFLWSRGLLQEEHPLARGSV